MHQDFSYFPQKSYLGGGGTSKILNANTYRVMSLFQGIHKK